MTTIYTVCLVIILTHNRNTVLRTYNIVPQFFIFSLTDDFETCQTLINMSDLYILIKLVISGAANYLRDCQQLFKTKQISHLSFTICAVKRYMYTSKFGASPKCSLVDNID